MENNAEILNSEIYDAMGCLATLQDKAANIAEKSDDLIIENRLSTVAEKIEEAWELLLEATNYIEGENDDEFEW